MYNDNILNRYINEKNLYNILNLNRNCSKIDIKKAYKKLILLYHPDKNFNENSNLIFIKIKQAYEILYNDETRAKYDKVYNDKHETCNKDIIFKFKEIFTNIFNKENIEKVFLEIFKYINYNKIDIIENLINSNFNVRILDIENTINFTLYEYYNNIPKKIIINRNSKNSFIEYIFPIDHVQIYDKEGEQIIFNNIKIEGNIIINIKIINISYKKILYELIGNDIYLKINNIIKNNKLSLRYLNNLEYKINLDNLNAKYNEFGKIYKIKGYGLPYFKTNNNVININDCGIKRGNLYFILLI